MSRHVLVINVTILHHCTLKG